MCHVLIYHSSNGIFHFNILIFQSGQRSDTQGTENIFSTVAYINTLIVKEKEKVILIKFRDLIRENKVYLLASYVFSSLL